MYVACVVVVLLVITIGYHAFFKKSHDSSQVSRHNYTDHDNFTIEADATQAAEAGLKSDKPSKKKKQDAVEDDWLVHHLIQTNKFNYLTPGDEDLAKYFKLVLVHQNRIPRPNTKV